MSETLFQDLFGDVWRPIKQTRTIFIPCVLGSHDITFLPLWGLEAVGRHRSHDCKLANPPWTTSYVVFLICRVWHPKSRIFIYNWPPAALGNDYAQAPAARWTHRGDSPAQEPQPRSIGRLMKKAQPSSIVVSGRPYPVSQNHQNPQISK